MQKYSIYHPHCKRIVSHEHVLPVLRRRRWLPQTHDHVNSTGFQPHSGIPRYLTLVEETGQRGPGASELLLWVRTGITAFPIDVPVSLERLDHLGDGAEDDARGHRHVGHSAQHPLDLWLDVNVD